jgi:signal peptidase
MTQKKGGLWRVISWILVIAIVVLAVLLVGVRFVGLKPYAVLSGSMEPTYHVGALIYVKPCDASEVQVGDPITFVLDENLTVATHRVVAIDESGEHFTTKGDANEAVDGAPVYYKNLIGKPVFTVPKLGYLANWIMVPPGKYIAIIAVVIFLLLLFAPDLLRKADEADKRAEARKAALDPEGTEGKPKGPDPDCRDGPP